MPGRIRRLLAAGLALALVVTLGQSSLAVPPAVRPSRPAVAAAVAAVPPGLRHAVLVVASGPTTSAPTTNGPTTTVPVTPSHGPSRLGPIVVGSFLLAVMAVGGIRTTRQRRRRRQRKV